MAKRSIYVRWNLSRGYMRCSSSDKYSYIEKKGRKRKAYLDLIGQHVKLFHTCCPAFCSQRFLLKEHFYSNTSPAISKAKSPATLKNIMLAKQTYIFSCFLQVHRGTLLTSAIAKRAIWESREMFGEQPNGWWHRLKTNEMQSLILNIYSMMLGIRWIVFSICSCLWDSEMAMNWPHPHHKMYRMTAKFKDIFKSPFSSFKILPIKVSLPMRFDSAMSFTLVWMVLFRPLLWYWLTPLKTLYLPYWFALRNTQPHTVGPFFNPLMQNKVCMWKFLLVMPQSDTPFSSAIHGPFLGQLV